MPVTATYYVETRISLTEAVARIANEQSGGLTDNDIARFGQEGVQRGTAEILSIEACDPLGPELQLPVSYPIGTPPEALKSCRATVRYPDVSFEAGTEAVLNVVMGEPQNLGVVSAIRLLNLTFDTHESMSGPRRGLRGLRQRLRVASRAMLCAPIKPSTGLDMDEHVERGRLAANGGSDVVKDDELCLDTCYNPLEQRVPRLTAALRRIEDDSGEGRLYVANLIGSRSGLHRRLDKVLSHGAEAVMVAPSLMGFDVVDDVRHHADVIVFAHSTFTLSFARVRNFGISLPLWVRLQRLLGADCILLPSHGGSFGVAALDTRQCVRECLDTHGFDGIQPTMPAHSGSMNAHTFELMEHLSDGDDFMFTSGSGLFDHPDGPEAGARELRQVIEGGNNGGNVAWLKAWQPHD